MESGLAGVGDLEPGPRCRGSAGGAKTGQAAPAHSGHRACKGGPERAAGHLADGGQRAQRPTPRGSSADPPSAALPPGPPGLWVRELPRLPGLRGSAASDSSSGGVGARHRGPRGTRLARCVRETALRPGKFCPGSLDRFRKVLQKDPRVYAGTSLRFRPHWGLDIGKIRIRGACFQTAELSLLRFLSAELTRGYFLEHNEAKYTERRERVYTCMRIPRELEKLMVFGIFLCLDAFLYVFTLLPLRVFLALFRLFTLPCYGLRDRRLLQPAQVCDILKGVILVICYFMMHYVDYSMMYHLIRGQSVIKLYIIYNMLEVADRLFSSFGQDILDALYWTATEPKERKRAHIGVIPHFFMAVLYVFLHAILIMVQATTLNVAFNSHNKSLLTIMMSNNFVEIKGSVFKKFEKNNLFQMSNSDIKERFTNYVLLLIVCLRNMEQFSWNPDHLWVLFPDVCMVIASETAVDIVKHAFITKFNDITADVYSEYRASLAFDLVSSRQKNAYTDYSDSVARRMGFIPLPLAVLLIRVVTSSIKVQGVLSYACVILFYFGLISLKILNSIVLLGKSCQYVKEAKMEDKLFNSPPASAPGKPPNKSQNKCKPSQEENLSASVTSQPVHPKENVIPLLVASSSDQFLTTPDGDEKDITQESSELKHRSAKKDLLEVDRFTICGNRID
ncbi:transmembrane anterior posterior transformation protein 1 homolog [Ailuropoda melanoleuca]|uniref:transmembrane anterior posterior transformation protein 1 homolog n=1 Tax=Ailuropoda melanoleuca TaxID=9646 RepID=UPI001494730F|nr:transmembrane anterior posterior transformation protein 1 homolog [Ailuropoda melanoleuca]